MQIDRKEMWKHGLPTIIFLFSSLTTRLVFDNYSQGLRVVFLVFGGGALIYLLSWLFSAKLEVIKNS
jgi:hypothetical protein